MTAGSNRTTDGDGNEDVDVDVDGRDICVTC